MKKIYNKNKHTQYSILNTQYREAFTLIEILIFTAIVSVFFVVSAAVSALSLNIMRTNENKIYATHYAEEAAEWILNEKDTTDWLTFIGRVGTYCMNNVATIDWSTATSCGSSYTLGTVTRPFNREVVLTAPGDGTISSIVTVTWKDASGNVLSVPIKSVYAQTE